MYHLSYYANNSCLYWLSAREDWQCGGLFDESGSELLSPCFIAQIFNEFAECFESGKRNTFLKSTNGQCNVLVICYVSLANLKNIGLTYLLNTLSLLKGLSLFWLLVALCDRCWQSVIQLREIRKELVK